MEVVAKKSVTMFIPVGEHPQDGDDKLMQHRAVWEPEDVAKMGYEVWHFTDWHTQAGKSTEAMFAVKRWDAPYSEGVIHRNRLDG